MTRYWPFSSGRTPEQAAEEIRKLVRELDSTYFAVVTVEHSYTELKKSRAGGRGTGRYSQVCQISG